MEWVLGKLGDSDTRPPPPAPARSSITEQYDLATRRTYYCDTRTGKTAWTRAELRTQGVTQGTALAMRGGGDAAAAAVTTATL